MTDTNLSASVVATKLDAVTSLGDLVLDFANSSVLKFSAPVKQAAGYIAAIVSNTEAAWGSASGASKLAGVLAVVQAFVTTVLGQDWASVVDQVIALIATAKQFWNALQLTAALV